jgi:hypothetical protein
LFFFSFMDFMDNAMGHDYTFETESPSNDGILRLCNQPINNFFQGAIDPQRWNFF